MLADSARTWCHTINKILIIKIIIGYLKKVCTFTPGARHKKTWKKKLNFLHFSHYPKSV